jgi:hypothetical protein
MVLVSEFLRYSLVQTSPALDETIEVELLSNRSLLPLCSPVRSLWSFVTNPVFEVAGGLTFTASRFEIVDVAT